MMSIFNSPRVRDIPRQKWVIPVPEKLPDEQYAEGWGSSPGISQVETVLMQMGFEKASSQCNHHARDFKDGAPTSEIQERSLWIHPAGVITHVCSKQGGRVTHMSLHAEIDAGVYGRSLMGSHDNCGGSGSCEPQLSGKSHYCKTWDWHSSILPTLKNIITKAQEAGRIVPFTQWTSNEMHIMGAFPLEALVMIDPVGAAGKTEHEVCVMMQAATEAAINERLSKWPGLTGLATKDLIDRDVHKKILGQSFCDRDWWKAENAMDYCRRVMKQERIRFPNAKTQALTEHWLRAIGSGEIDSLTASDPLMVNPGPGGARFATCLALEMRRDDGWDRMVGLLDSMNDDQLRDWAGSQDAQGNTPFGELVFSHATEQSIFLPNRDQIINLFELVAGRIGANSCPVVIGNKKPWMVLEDAFGQARKGGDSAKWSAIRYIRNLPAIVNLFDRLEAKGCRDVVLDADAMHMIDRMRQTTINLDGNENQPVDELIPVDTLARIEHMMMHKTVDAPRAPDSRQMGRF